MRVPVVHRGANDRVDVLVFTSGNRVAGHRVLGFVLNEFLGFRRAMAGYVTNSALGDVVGIGVLALWRTR